MPEITSADGAPAGAPAVWRVQCRGLLPAMAQLDEALAAYPWSDCAPSVVLTELASDDGAEVWQLDAYFLTPPAPDLLRRLGLPGPAEPVADADWVSASQAGLDPVRAGRFVIHAGAAPDQLPLGAVALSITAGQAFGTGHHETTRGCLRVLDRLQRRTPTPALIWDVGTGTGVLALAAARLWPRAQVLASDIDSVAIDVTRAMARANRARLGRGRGRVMTLTAPGLHHRAFRHGPRPQLVLANILAGPLVALAPRLAPAIRRAGILVMAGLLETQARQVSRAYEQRGFRRHLHLRDGDWPTLVLVKRGRNDKGPKQ